MVILCGRGAYFQKKWPYGVGVVTSTLTTPTQYDHFFLEYAPLPHHIATFRTISTLGHDPPPMVPTWPDLSVDTLEVPDSVHFVKVCSKSTFDNANFVNLWAKFISDKAHIARDWTNSTSQNVNFANRGPNLVFYNGR